MQTRLLSFVRAAAPALFLLLILGGACSDSPGGGTTDTGIDTADTSGGDIDNDAPDVHDTDGDAADTSVADGDATDTTAPDGSGDADQLLDDGEICEADQECASRICLRADVGGTTGVCTSYCFDSEDCEEGTSCVFFANSGGDAIRVCVPDDLCIDGDDDQFGLGAGCLGGDCDDTDPDINPAAPELCDSFDNDCNGLVDDRVEGAGSDCDTGFVGVCSVGVLTCVGGTPFCESTRTAGPEICDGLDNDCDGFTDEDDDDEPLSQTCYGGPEGTEGVGHCTAGSRTCVDGSWSACAGQVLPFPEICDEVDNDCDGETDEDAIGGTVRCDTGLPGICASGFQGCGEESECIAINEAAAESCDGLDNDCDGLTDEDEDGDPIARACYDGAEGTLGVGVCVGGTQTCSGGEFGSCIDDVVPTVEICDGLDNDCDGEPDDDAIGTGGSCSTGQPGVCALGYASCDEGGAICVPVVAASAEVCDGLDNDCDGLTDEDEDDEGLTRSCYTGPAGTLDVGTCHGGTETCVGGGWTSCVDQAVPTFEQCDLLDNDCDGVADEDDPEGGAACDTGAVGVCARGVTTCEAGGIICNPIYESDTEICDGLDNDCDGLIDEGPGGGALARVCYNGPEGTSGVGICQSGTETCVAGEWSSCLDQVIPSFEVCDTIDNDCDGSTDENNPEGGFACDTGELGVCAQGSTICTSGTLLCTQLFEASPEICDGFDNDCDGEEDEGSPGVPLSRSCYDGPDGTEGVGSCVGGTATCRFGDYGGCVGQIIPVTEVCDYEDNDCDGEVDEDALLSFYVDADFDGYGDPASEVLACAGPGYVTNGLDCYDLNAFANPDQEGFFPEDRGDGSFDYNCDGLETDFFPDTDFGLCSSDPPLCYLIVEGWDEAAGPPPECGLEGTYIFDCLGNGNNCDPTTALTTQKCH